MRTDFNPYKEKWQYLNNSFYPSVFHPIRIERSESIDSKLTILLSVLKDFQLKALYQDIE
jgi:hypothetical protein